MAKQRNYRAEKPGCVKEQTVADPVDQSSQSESSTPDQGNLWLPAVVGVFRAITGTIVGGYLGSLGDWFGILTGGWVGLFGGLFCGFWFGSRIGKTKGKS